MLSTRLLGASIKPRRSFHGEFSKVLARPLSTTGCRDEKDERNNNARRGNHATRRVEVMENGGGGGRTVERGVARGDRMKRKGGERERASVFAIIIIAGFLPRMLREQQVGAFARSVRARGQSYRITTNRNRSPVISEPRWRLDYRPSAEGRSRLHVALETEKISEAELALALNASVRRFCATTLCIFFSTISMK